MKKKLLLIAACLFAGALVGCGSDLAEHQHEYVMDKWEYDAYVHYHVADCTSVNHRKDVALHEGDKCFCGYDATTYGQSTSPSIPTTTTGDDKFGEFSVSADGRLSFNAIKGVSKYVMTIEGKGDRPTTTLKVPYHATSVNLASEITGGFPSGKTKVTFQAWYVDKIEIDGETYEEEVPMTGVSQTFTVINLNGSFSLQNTTFEDEYVKLDGFYTEKSGDDATKYVYETVLTDNKATRFNVSKYVKAKSGSEIQFYSSATGRENMDANSVISGFDLMVQEIGHGSNTFYLRAVDADGITHDYDLCVYGLYTMSITRSYLSVTATDDAGVRSFSYAPVGETIKVTERDILTGDALYDGVEEGMHARDQNYNVVEKKDILLSAQSGASMSLYFYAEKEVRADCAEVRSYASNFNVTDTGEGMSLSYVSGSASVPYVIAGKIVQSAYFNNYDWSTIRVEEGFTTYHNGLVRLNNCPNLEHIYLPSTVTTMGEWAFSGMPSNATIHCAFEEERAESFPYNWNQISGSFSYYATEYAPSTEQTKQRGGVEYEIEGEALTVVGTTRAFRGIIPDEETIDGKTYPVTKINSLYGSGAWVDLYIGKNVSEIKNGALLSDTSYQSMGTKMRSIAVSAENKNFLLEYGVLYNAEYTRALATNAAEDFYYFKSSILAIDEDDYKSVWNASSGQNAYVEDSKEVWKEKTGEWANQHSAIFEKEAGVTYLTVSFYDNAEKAAMVFDIQPTEHLILKDFGGLRHSAFPNAASKLDNLKKITMTTDYLSVLDELFADGYPKSVEEIVLSKFYPSEYGYGFYDLSKFENAKRCEITDEASEYMSYSGVLYKKQTMTVEAVPVALEGHIVIPEGVKEIVGDYFRGKNMTGISFPNTLTLIDAFTFSGCNRLEEVVLPNSPLEIGYEAFSHCIALKSVTFTNAETIIGGKAFAYCFNLESFTVPAEIEMHGYYGGFDATGEEVLLGCIKLTTIVYQGTRAQCNQSCNGIGVEYGITCRFMNGSYVTTIVCTDGKMTVSFT